MGWPRFVSPGSGDNEDTLAPAFWENPEKFKPTVGHGLDTWHRCFTWGTSDEEWDKRHGGTIARMMKANNYTGSPSAERQFINALIEKKKRLLAAAKPTAEPFYERDFVVDVDLFEPFEREASNLEEPPTMQELLFASRIDDRCFRTVRVSGGITLRALHDKVLAPMFGFVRNYHGYVFTDLSDRDAKLGDILQSVGAQMYWIYDLGDRYEFIITVKEIKKREESTGRVEVLDGAFAGPPEDSGGLEGSGSRGYAEFLSDIVCCERGSGEWKALCRRIDAAFPLNYRGKSYDPDDFSVEKAQQAIEEALRSAASKPEGAKQFMAPYGAAGRSLQAPGALAATMYASPGSKVVEKPAFDTAGLFSGLPTGFLERSMPRIVETVSDGSKMDKKRDDLCANCGNANQLRRCTGCLKAKFCSTECSRQAWKWHKAECGGKK